MIRKGRPPAHDGQPSGWSSSTRRAWTPPKVPQRLPVVPLGVSQREISTSTRVPALGSRPSERSGMAASITHSSSLSWGSLSVPSRSTPSLMPLSQLRSSLVPTTRLRSVTVPPAEMSNAYVGALGASGVSRSAKASSIQTGPSWVLTLARMSSSEAYSDT